MVRDFEMGDSDGGPLLEHLRRLLMHMTRNYPPVWFPEGRKDAEGLVDLSHRCFVVCARVEKGRFPFKGRRPFACFVEDGHDGSQIAYHTVYAKLSVARELMRNDYAANLRSNPEWRERAKVYSDLGSVLEDLSRAERIVHEVGSGKSLGRWRLSGAGLRAVVPRESLLRELKGARGEGLSALVVRALSHGGPMGRSELANLIGEATATEELGEGEGGDIGTELRLSLRRVVLRVWGALSEEERALLRVIGRGGSYEELVTPVGPFPHKVAVSRALAKVGGRFLESLGPELGCEGQKSGAKGPLALVESILELVGDQEGEP
jgi:hypothetical protein